MKHTNKSSIKIALLSVLALGAGAGAVASAGVAQADTKEWRLDKGHAHIGWDIYHMGLSRTNGRFNTFDGEFMLDDEDFSNSKVKFNIDANSVDSNHLGRDNHLRTNDYLDVDKHPVSPTGLSVSLDLRFDLVDCTNAKPTNIPCNWGYVDGFKGPSE